MSDNKVFHFTEKEILAHVMQAATRADIAELRMEHHNSISRLDAKIDRLEDKLDSRIDKLDSRIDRLDARFDKMFYFQIVTILSVIATGVGLFFK